MKSASNAYEKGKGAFYKGEPRKPTNDFRFMDHVNSLEIEGMTPRQVKKNEMDEWKRGWDDGKVESQEPVVEEAPKKKKKKKKVSKKKSEK